MMLGDYKKGEILLLRENNLNLYGTGFLILEKEKPKNNLVFYLLVAI